MIADMDIVRNIESQALGFPELKRMLGSHAKSTRLMQYDDLKQVDHIRKLFHGKKAVIILMSIEGPDAPSVGHWIALLDMGDHYEHFDSYGLSADEELSLTHEEPYLTKLIAQADMRVQDSSARFQSMRDHTNTCGRWCVARVKLGNRDLEEFQKLIETAHTVPDVTVSLMTMFL